MRKTLLILMLSFGLMAVAQSVTVNPNDYRYDMSAYVNIDESVHKDGYTTLVAMVNGECRGVGIRQQKSGYSWYYVRIYSNVATGEKVSFRLVNEQTADGKCLGVKGADDVVSYLAFEQSKAVGVPSAPAMLYDFTSAKDVGDVDGDGTLSVLDITLLISHLKGEQPEPFDASVADVNNDKVIDVVDVTALRELILGLQKP